MIVKCQGRGIFTGCIFAAAHVIPNKNWMKEEKGSGLSGQPPTTGATSEAEIQRAERLPARYCPGQELGVVTCCQKGVVSRAEDVLPS